MLVVNEDAQGCRVCQCDLVLAGVEACSFPNDLPLSGWLNVQSGHLHRFAKLGRASGVHPLHHPELSLLLHFAAATDPLRQALGPVL